MKKLTILFLLFLLFSCADIGRHEPGGVLIIHHIGTVSSDLNVVVVLDSDALFDNGNEYKIVVPVGQFVVGGALDTSITWHASDIPTGNYYAYAWFDIDNNGSIGGTEEVASFDVYDPANNYNFSLTDPAGLRFDAGTLFPNYSVWESFTGQITFNLDFNGV